MTTLLPDTDTLPLEDLIEELTRPHVAAVHQHGRLLGHRAQKPLLDLLAEARTSSLGRGGETRSRAERVQLNIAAHELETAITTTVRRWALDVGYRPPRTGWHYTRHVLTHWYASARHSPDLAVHESTIRGWHTAIVELLIDPPRRWTLNTPCPRCGQRWARTGDDRVDALQVSERDPIHATLITCRACDATWTGIHGARALAASTGGAA